MLRKYRHSFKRYAYIRNECNRIIKSAKTSYGYKLAKECKQNPSAFWKYVQSKQKMREVISHLRKPDGGLTKDDVEKVTELNNFFCSVFVNEDSCTEEIPNFTHQNDSLPDVEITAEKVCNKLRKLNGTKSRGPDNIRLCLLKACCEELAEPLSLILQNHMMRVYYQTNGNEQI